MAELITWCRIMRVGPACPHPCDDCRRTSGAIARSPIPFQHDREDTMTDSPNPTPADAQPHPFDPALFGRIGAAVTEARSVGATFATIRTTDAAELLERDAYAERTRLQLAEACATLRQQRNDALAIIDRVTARMEDSAHHGSGSVNVRQVLNLLSPTWPDGNYSAPPPADLAPPLAPPLRRGARVRLVEQVAHCGPGCEGTVTAILATIHPVQVDVDGYGILNCPPSALERIDTRKDG